MARWRADILRHRAERLGTVEAANLPTLGHTVPSGPPWVYEIKHDGYRFIRRRDSDHVRVFSRRTGGPARLPQPFSYSTTAIISISTIASG